MRRRERAGGHALTAVTDSSVNSDLMNIARLGRVPRERKTDLSQPRWKLSRPCALSAVACVGGAIGLLWRTSLVTQKRKLPENGDCHYGRPPLPYEISRGERGQALTSETFSIEVDLKKLHSARYCCNTQPCEYFITPRAICRI